MTDSLKNMISSVDWKKLLSSSDAKNAVVGSALGGLMLGGASLMSDRDPEESKWTPVGDALLGALLGGAAGYGIPKGLAMFRDSGSLAPDNDQLTPQTGHDVRNGALLGAGVGVGSTLPAHARAIGRRWDIARGVFDTRSTSRQELLNAAKQSFTDAKANPATSKADLDMLARKLRSRYILNAAYTDRGAGSFAEARKALLSELAHPNGRSRLMILKDLKTLLNSRSVAQFGVRMPFAGGISDIWDEIGNEKKPLATSGSTLRSALAARLKNFTNGQKFAPKTRNIGRMLSWTSRPGMRMFGPLGRVARTGAAGALAGLLLSKAFGPSVRDNIKN